MLMDVKMSAIVRILTFMSMILIQLNAEVLPSFWWVEGDTRYANVAKVKELIFKSLSCKGGVENHSKYWKGFITNV